MGKLSIETQSKLKESKDEKIRKALIKYHKSTIDIDGIKGDKIVSWLEKQGTHQTPDEIIEECYQDNADHIIDMVTEQGKLTNEEMKELLRTEYEKGRADAIAEMQLVWSEEDEEYMRYLYTLVDNAASYEYNKKVKSFLKSLRPLKGNAQPQQGWSEEDSKRLQRIIDFLWYNRKGDTDTIYQQEQDIKWLKDRVQPQSK